MANPLKQSVPRLLGIILFVSIALRVGAALYVGSSVTVLPGTADQLSYHTLALRVLNGFGFTFGETWWPMTPAGSPTAHWSFLYTLYLTAVYKTFGANPLAARLLQAVLVGLAQPLLIFAIGRRVWSPQVGLVAAGWTALYGYFIYYAATLMTEPFYITAILAALLALIYLADVNSGRVPLALALGLALGAAVLLRQLFLLLIPFLLLWLWWSRWRRAERLPLLESALAVGVVILLILPISLYNTQRFDRFVLLNTNAGFAFFWGNHPVHGTTFVPILTEVEYGELVPVELRGLDEASLEKALLDRGLQFIFEDPIRYLQLSVSRIAPYFKFWPEAESDLLSNLARVGSFGLALPFMLAGLVMGLAPAAVRGRGGALDPALLLLLFALLYTAIHVLTWTLIRYRLPVDSVLLLFAALPVAALLDREPARGQGLSVAGERSPAAGRRA